jgi:DEAD/DEAH box helicase domain-containing protein
MDHARSGSGHGRGREVSAGSTHRDLVLELAATHPSGLLRHVERLPQRDGRHGAWPVWAAPTLIGALVGSGIERPWSHQVEAAEAVWRREHVVLSTGTASGKSLGYLLPVLTALIDGATAPSGRGATTLYLAPTKALAADQRARIDALALPLVRASTYDGDTAPDERRWAREHANYVLTNPDLLHYSLLPGHERWTAFLRALQFVIVDECHAYRGVFGSHTALVLRRLRRVCARYGAHPTFVLASATVADPGSHAERLIGLPVRSVVDDGSSRPAVTVGLWEPRRVNGTRRSAVAESADLLADLVAADVQTVAFARSRAGVEVLAAAARSRLEREGRPAGVAAYRGGYLPEERRLLERDLRERRLVGMAATSALELGIDISGLDAVLVAGWPGTRASFWQQVGRAGREATPATALLVAADDPLDSYLVSHPDAVFGTPVEASVVDPENPHVLGPHLAAAAAELPLTEADAEVFGPSTVPLAQALTRAGVLRRRPNGWFWAREDRAADHVRLRGVGEQVAIVERGSGRVIGTVDEARAPAHIHPGAVHLHQGQPYVVTALDLDARSALVVAGDPGWSTQSRSVSEFALTSELAHRRWGEVRLSFGTVEVTSQVVSFLRRLHTGEVLGEHPLDLPRRTLSTRAVWWTMPVDLLSAVGVTEAATPGSAHAAEHAAIGLLPLIATADRWDIGGVSTARHPDTGLPTILVYDGYPGGAGFAERGFHRASAWLSATAEAIGACRCETGCPACVLSPKCGNGNDPLDKAGAVALLGAVLARADADRSPG